MIITDHTKTSATVIWTLPVWYKFASFAPALSVNFFSWHEMPNGTSECTPSHGTSLHSGVHKDWKKYHRWGVRKDRWCSQTWCSHDGMCSDCASNALYLYIQDRIIYGNYNKKLVKASRKFLVLLTNLGEQKIYHR